MCDMVDEKWVEFDTWSQQKFPVPRRVLQRTRIADVRSSCMRALMHMNYVVDPSTDSQSIFIGITDQYTSLQHLGVCYPSNPWMACNPGCGHRHHGCKGAPAW